MIEIVQWNEKARLKICDEVWEYDSLKDLEKDLEKIWEMKTKHVPDRYKTKKG